MPAFSSSLASEQAFSHLGIKTDARDKLDQAVRAYHKTELVRSAQLFLESWRILRNEYESGLHDWLGYSLPLKARIQREQSVVRESKGRMLLSLLALHDLASACSRVYEEYKDKTGKCKLDVYALQYGWEVDITTEELEIEKHGVIKPLFSKGSDIAHVLQLKDPLGRLLDEANSFKEAAFVIASICSIQLASVLEPSKEHQEGCDFINESLLLMRRRTAFEIVSMQAGNDNRPHDQTAEKVNSDSEVDEDMKTRKNVLLKLKDTEAKNNPLKKKDELELAGLFDQLRVTNLPEQLNHQLKRFHFTERAGPWQYKGRRFEHIQEEENDSDDEDEEEKRPLLRSNQT